MSKYNYKGIIEAQKKEKIIEEYMRFSSNELVEILIDRDLEIERLTENNQAMQEELCKVWDERDNAYRRILDAVDNLETPYFRECEQQCKDVINILKGSDKE